MFKEGMNSRRTNSQSGQDIEKGGLGLQRPQVDQSISGMTVVQNPTTKEEPPEGNEHSEPLAKQGLLKNNKWIPSRIWFLVVPLGLVACWIPAILEWLKFPHARIWGVRLTFWSIWLSILWAGWWIALVFSWIIHKIILSCINWFDGFIYRPYVNALDCLHPYFAHIAWALATWISWVPVIVERQVNDGGEQSGSSRSARALDLGGRLFFAMAISTGILYLEKIAVQWIAMSFHKRAYQKSIQDQKEAVNAFKTLHGIVKKYHPGKIHGHKRGRFDATTGISEDSILPPYADAHRHTSDHDNQARSPMKTAFADAWIQIFGDVTPDDVSKAFHRKKENMIELSERFWDCLAEHKSDEKTSSERFTDKPSEPNLATTGEQLVLYKNKIERVVEENHANESNKTKKRKERSYLEDKREWEIIWNILTNGRPHLEFLTEPQFNKRCLDLHAEQWRLEGTMNDLNSVVGKLDNLMLLLWLVSAAIITAVAMEAELKTLIFGAGSAFVAMSWLLKDTASEVLGSIVFLFSKHPYDVGDRVAINSKMYTVKEMRLLSTVFWDDDSVQVQAPNKLLNTLFIHNLRRSTATSEPFKYEISHKTTQAQLDLLTRDMKTFLRNHGKDYRPDFLVVIQELSRESCKMVVTSDIKYNNSWESNPRLRAERRNKWIIHLQKALDNAGIEGPGMPTMKIVQGQ